MRRLLPAITVVIVLLICGAVHGLWTERWSARADLSIASAKLDKLAATLSDWEGGPLTRTESPAAGVHAAVTRRYVHRETGEAVTVYLACGRGGPLALHTPDVCYAANGYADHEATTYTCGSRSVRPGIQFRTGHFHKRRAVQAPSLRIFWSWYQGQSWMVSENPRDLFFREPLLYKLYLIREQANRGETVDNDPCLDLADHLLPHLENDVLVRLHNKI